MSAATPSCPLCQTDGGELLWRGAQLRVIEVADADYPGFTRVIWNAHQPEMTSLTPAERDQLMRAVYAVEQVQREVLQADKINLAALGNMVPHLHWHLIPRWREDRHFPNAIWAAPNFAAQAEPADFLARRQEIAQRLPGYRERVVQTMEQWQRDTH